MYASIRRYTVNPADAAEVFRRLETAAESMLPAIPGLVGYYAVDGGDESTGSVSVFQDKAGADESNAPTGAGVKENLLPDIELSPVDITDGEVMMHF